MASSLQTRVAQLHISGGLWQESAACLRVVEQRSRFVLRSTKDKLYMVIEWVGGFPDPDDICARIADLIEETYYANRGSVTARLWAALKEANLDLFELNRDAPTNERGILGISCVLLRGADLYVIQAGPGVAYLLHDGALQRFPSQSPWLSKTLPSSLSARQAMAIGWRRDVEPDLFYGQVEPGDMIVLASSDLSRAASADQLVRILTRGNSDEVRDALIPVAKGRELSAIVVQFTDLASWEGQAPIVGAARPARRSADEAGLAESGVGPNPDADARLSLVSAEDDWASEEEWDDDWGGRGQVDRRRMDDDPIPLPWERNAPRERPASVWDIVKRAGAALVTLGKRMLPEQAASGSGQAGSEVSPAWRVLRVVMAVLLIPLIVMGVMYVNRQRDQQQIDQALLDKLDLAKQQWVAAQSGSPEAQRTLLLDTRTLAQEISVEAPDNALAHALQMSVTQRLELLDKVVRINYVGRLQPLDRAATSTAPARMVMSGSTIYVLDRDAATVDKYALDLIGEGLTSQIPNRLFPTSDLSSELAQHQIADIAVIHGDMPDEAPSLFMLTDGGHILSKSANSRSLTTGTLLDGQVWSMPCVADTYGTPPNHFIYVLDPAANLIRKYQAWQDAYSDAPEDYPLTGEVMDLSQGVDMAIDGNIYVLLSSGQIIKLYQGRRADFEQRELPDALMEPVALSASNRSTLDMGYIFVADAGAQRIIQFNKDGLYIRQFKPALDLVPWDQLSDIWIDDAATRLYFVNRNTLCFFNLP